MSLDTDPNNCAGNSKPVSDGTGEYALISLSIEQDTQPPKNIETVGCFVKNDSNFQKYIPDIYPPEDPGFLMYFYCSEPDFEKKVQQIKILAHPFEKPTDAKKKTTFKIGKESHKFLPVCPTSDYGVSLTENDLSEGNYKGIEMVNGHPKSVPFKAVSNKENELYVNEACVFERLRAGGPLLCQEGDSWNLVGWYVKDLTHNIISVRHLKAQELVYIWKDLDSCQMANKDTDTDDGSDKSNEYQELVDTRKDDQMPNEDTDTEFEDKSVSGSPSDSYVSSIYEETCHDQHDVHSQLAVSSGCSSGQSGLADSVHSASSSSQHESDSESEHFYENLPRGIAATDEASMNWSLLSDIDKQLPPGTRQKLSKVFARQRDTPQIEDPRPVQENAQAAIKFSEISIQDLFKNPYVVDCLTILDIKYKNLPNQCNWKHLAEELSKVLGDKEDKDIIEKCNCPSKSSPTMDILERPNIKCKTVQDLEESLQSEQRGDVLDILKTITDKTQSIERALSRELLERIATKLDQPCHSTFTSNWRGVGKRLGIKDNDLDLIENGGSNPAEELLEYAYKCVPPNKTTAGEFRKIIRGFSDRNDLHDLIKDMGITRDDDKRPLEVVIPPHGENMANMTAALNNSRQKKPIWKELASNWGLANFQIDQLDSLTPQSPIKKLIEWMHSRNVKMTADKFLGMLKKIKRFDVKKLVEVEIYNAHKERQSYQQPSTLSIPVQRQTSVSNQQGECT